MSRTGPWVARLRGASAVLLCAFAAHALAYGSALPDDRAHGYYGWYAPLVGAFSTLALAVIGLSVLSAVAGLGPRLPSVLPERNAPSGPRFARLALSAWAVLAVQETVEHSLEAGRLGTGFSPAGWLLLLAAVLPAAALLTFLARSCVALLEALGVAQPPLESRRSAGSWHRSGELRVRRRSTLASPGGERAPPAVAC
jgi:hypothetical protein